jgi:hypothetical protein
MFRQFVLFDSKMEVISNVARKVWVSDNGTNNYHSFLGYDAVWMVYKYKVLEVLAAAIFTLVVKGRNFDQP